MHRVPEIKLIRTDTTLDLSQKVEKWSVKRRIFFHTYFLACGEYFFHVILLPRSLICEYFCNTTGKKSTTTNADCHDVGICVEQFWSILTWRGSKPDHEGASSRARLLHCTQFWLTPAITPNVSNSTVQFLVVGTCVRARPLQ